MTRAAQLSLMANSAIGDAAGRTQRRDGSYAKVGRDVGYDCRPDSTGGLEGERMRGRRVELGEVSGGRAHLLSLVSRSGAGEFRGGGED